MSTCGDHEETKSVFSPKLCLIPKCDLLKLTIVLPGDAGTKYVTQ